MNKQINQDLTCLRSEIFSDCSIIPVLIAALATFVSEPETSSNILRLDPIFFSNICTAVKVDLNNIYFFITNCVTLTSDAKFRETLVHQTRSTATLTKYFSNYSSLR